MKLKDFKLERYFARHEFTAPYLLCCSDCESFTVKDILELEGESAIRSFQDLRLSYTESHGNPELRRIIASLYSSMEAGEILVTSGAEEAIFIFMNISLAPGDHVVVQSPCYQSLYEVARALGCQVTPWEMKEENGWEPDIETLKKIIGRNTRAIVINSPHNPTGCLISGEKLASIAELARSRDILLFSDEVYRFLEYDQSDRHPAACDIYENAVSLGVMSKAFGLAGLRIGWVATKNSEIYKKMAAFKDYTTICSSAPGEFLAALALKNRDYLVRRNLDIIEKNLAVLDQFFHRHRDLFSWTRPKAGPVAFPGICQDIGADVFCSGLVRDRGVLLLPGTCFDCGNKNFRIGFGRKDLPECVEKLEGYVSENYRSISKG